MPLDDLLMVGLRRREGVNLVELAASHGLEEGRLKVLGERLEPFLARGLLCIEGPRWRLSEPEGLALSNAVLREVLLWWDPDAARGSSS